MTTLQFRILFPGLYPWGQLHTEFINPFTIFDITQQHQYTYRSVSHAVYANLFPQTSIFHDKIQNIETPRPMKQEAERYFTKYIHVLWFQKLEQAIHTLLQTNDDIVNLLRQTEGQYIQFDMKHRVLGFPGKNIVGEVWMNARQRIMNEYKRPSHEHPYLITPFMEHALNPFYHHPFTIHGHSYNNIIEYTYSALIEHFHPRGRQPLPSTGGTHLSYTNPYEYTEQLRVFFDEALNVYLKHHTQQWVNRALTNRFTDPFLIRLLNTIDEPIEINLPPESIRFIDTMLFHQTNRWVWRYRKNPIHERGFHIVRIRHHLRSHHVRNWVEARTRELLDTLVIIQHTFQLELTASVFQRFMHLFYGQCSFPSHGDLMANHYTSSMEQFLVREIAQRSESLFQDVSVYQSPILYQIWSYMSFLVLHLSHFARGHTFSETLARLYTSSDQTLNALQLYESFRTVLYALYVFSNSLLNRFELHRSMLQVCIDILRFTDLIHIPDVVNETMLDVNIAAIIRHDILYLFRTDEQTTNHISILIATIIHQMNTQQHAFTLTQQTHLAFYRSNNDI